jgi:hypothetical protein
VERNKEAVRDAKKIARLLASEARWESKKAAMWIAVFVGEVRWMTAEPPRDAGNGQAWLDDDLPF